MLRRSLAGLLILVIALPLGAAEGAPAKKKKKKADPYAGSKYKSYHALTPEAGHSYRFDQRGDPILPRVAKKNVSKKKNFSNESEAKSDCSSGQTCGEKPKGADERVKLKP